MGRTVPSFRMLLEGIIGDLSVFRRALRGNDIEAFDRLMNKARAHASSCTVTPMLEPMDAVFLSILVGGREGRQGNESLPILYEFILIIYANIRW